MGLHALVLALFLLLLGTSVSAAPQPGHVHFTAAGDFGTSSNAMAVLNTIDATDSDFTLALGDLSYGVTGQEQAWCDSVTSRVGAGYPFEVVSGNHEGNGQNGNINDFTPCLPNQLPGAVGTYGRQYYVDVPAENPIARFIMISPNIQFPDSTWSYTAGSTRYAWTANAIDGARNASIPWVVVGMHKPCLSVGDYGCEPGPDLYNMLLSKKVDLILSGHDHVYQRTHQLGLRTGCTTLSPGTFNSSCVIDSDSTFTQGAGSVAMTVATGGQGLYDVNAADSETNYFAATAGLNKNGTFGVLDVDATDDTLQASFVRAAGGTFTDSFTISRNTSPNVPPVASFTSSCSNLTCSFNAGASTDSDGSIAGYAWEFGDGTTATGVTTSHTYSQAGSFSVRLTVTDNSGGDRRRHQERHHHRPARQLVRVRSVHPDGQQRPGCGADRRELDRWAERRPTTASPAARAASRWPPAPVVGPTSIRFPRRPAICGSSWASTSFPRPARCTSLLRAGGSRARARTGARSGSPR